MAKAKENKKPAPEAEVKVEIKAPAPAAVGPKWIKVNDEQLAQLQADGKLVGYRPDTSEALVK